jgi:hypothetical protein
MVKEDRADPFAYERYGFLVFGWLVFGWLIKRAFSVETLQMYVIVSLLAAFIHFGTRRGARKAGASTGYSFLDPADVRDLQDEVIPHVAERRCALALGWSGEDAERRIPAVDSAEGGALRKLLARSDLSFDEQKALIATMRRNVASELPASGADGCLCRSVMPGSGLRKTYQACCLPLQQWLAEQEKKKR